MTTDTNQQVPELFPTRTVGEIEIVVATLPGGIAERVVNTLSSRPDATVVSAPLPDDEAQSEGIVTTVVALLGDGMAPAEALTVAGAVLS